MEQLLLSATLLMAFVTLIICIYILTTRSRIHRLFKLTSDNRDNIDELKNKLNDITKNKKGWK